MCYKRILTPTYRGSYIETPIEGRLDEGSPSIDASPAQMAEDLPGHLVPAVNQRLQLLGSSFQVSGREAVAAGNKK